MARVLGFYIPPKTTGSQNTIDFAIIDAYKRELVLGQIPADGTTGALEELIQQLTPEKVLTWGEWAEEKIVGIPLEQYGDLPQLQGFREILEDLCDTQSFFFYQQQFSREEILSRVVQALIRYCALLPVQIKNEYSMTAWTQSTYVKLDSAACQALNLFGSDESSLISLLDNTITILGSRFLKASMNRPLRDLSSIQKRLEVVNHLFHAGYLGTALRKLLKKVPDLRDLYFKMYKAKQGKDQGKENKLSLKKCMQLYRFSLALKELLNDVHEDEEGVLAETFSKLRKVRDQLGNFNLVIEKGLEIDDYFRTGEIYISRKFDQNVADLRIARDAVVRQIQQLQQKAVHELGARSVKLVESIQHTWLLEGTRKEIDAAFRKLGGKNPYQIVQSNKNNITFTSSDIQIKVKEQRRLNDQMIEAQAAVESKIRDLVASYYPVVYDCVDLIGELDMLQSFAVVSERQQFQRPNLVYGGSYVLPELKHPCLQTLQVCVPNSVSMTKGDSCLHIITGPNMGGKTTYLRQIAIASFMAQIGCFISCGLGHNELPVVDAIIARVGASDHQLKGISTFASEMIEVNAMLKQATSDSLIIVDELGRGTSTTEGFGLVWGLCEYLLNNIQSYTFLATHFQELIRLNHPLARNYYMEVQEQEGQLEMMYRVHEGIMQFSYGIEIAKLLGFDQAFIELATATRSKLESDISLDSNKYITEDGKIDYSKLVI